jgi:VanZ family protein
MKSRIKLLIILISLLILVPFFLIPSDLKMEVLNKIQIDTVGHIIGFFGLSWILVRLIKLPLVNTVICLFFYSALTELSQYYLGFRSGEFFDFVADVVGISLFAILQWLIAVYGKPQGLKN